jgi:KaiC/GvpD/RAD55 family RecA-like ATPase
LAEADARVHLASRASVGLTAGHTALDDSVNAFDRSFRWFRVEPRYDITPTLYVDVRYSEIGTYDSAEGYHFDGLMIADGGTFGYDVRRFRRVSGGIGWKANPHTLFKVEVGEDRFWLIDGSPLSADAGDRTFFGFDLTVSF